MNTNNINPMDDPAMPHGPLGDTMHGEDGRVWHQYPAGIGMSLRQYAAIHLCVPDSGIPKLDEMIEKARRQEMVGRALQGLLANPGGPIQHNPMRGWDLTNSTWDDVSSVAATAADSAIKAMEEKP